MEIQVFWLIIFMMESPCIEMIWRSVMDENERRETLEEAGLTSDVYDEI